MADNGSQVEGDNPEQNNLVDKDGQEHSEEKEDPRWYFITEAVLIIGGIPSIIFFITGLVNGILHLTEQRDYEICVLTKKFNNDETNDHIPEYLIGASVTAWVLIILYGNIMFS